MYINRKKVKDELTGNWRREFIEKFTKELQKSPYSYSLKEANDIAMKRADNEQNKRFDNVDAMVRHNLSNTLTKAQYEKEYNDSIVKDDIQFNEKDKEFFQKVMPQLVATFVKHYKREPTEQEIAELRKVGSIGVGMAKAFRTMAGKDTIKDDIKIEFIGVMFEFVEGHHPNIDRNMNKVFSLSEINKILEQEDRVAYEQNSKHGGMYDKCAFYGIFKINGERYKVQLARRVDLGDGVKYGKQAITLTNEDIERTKRSILNNGRQYFGGLKRLDSMKKDSKVKDTNFSSRLKLYADTFYATDFKDGNDAKRWWVNEFKKASNMKSKELKEWAEDMLDYTKDISVPYIKEDTTNLLKDIVKGKVTDSKARDYTPSKEYVGKSGLRNLINDLKQFNGSDNGMGYKWNSNSNGTFTAYGTFVKANGDNWYASVKVGNKDFLSKRGSFDDVKNSLVSALSNVAKDIEAKYSSYVSDSLKTFKVNGKVVKAKDEFDAIKKVRDGASTTMYIGINPLSNDDLYKIKEICNQYSVKCNFNNKDAELYGEDDNVFEVIRILKKKGLADSKKVKDGNLGNKRLRVGQVVRLDPSKRNGLQSLPEDEYVVTGFMNKGQSVNNDEVFDQYGADSNYTYFNGIGIKSKKTGVTSYVNRYQLMDSKNDSCQKKNK